MNMSSIFDRRRCLLLIVALAAFSLPSLSAHALSEATINATARVSVCGNRVRDGGEQCDGRDLGIRNCRDAGWTGGSLACTASCELNFSGCVSAADKADSVRVPARGGNITADAGSETPVDLSVPPDTSALDLTFIVFVYPDEAIEPSEPPPSGTDIIGNVYDIKVLTADGNVVHDLTKPVTITLRYADADVSAQGEQNLAVYTKEFEDASWRPVAGAVIDPSANTATFSTDDFSLFAIVSAPTAPPNPEPPVSTSPGSGSVSHSSGSASPPNYYSASAYYPAVYNPKPNREREAYATSTYNGFEPYDLRSLGIELPAADYEIPPRPKTAATSSPAPAKTTSLADKSAPSTTALEPVSSPTPIIIGAALLILVVALMLGALVH